MTKTDGGGGGNKRGRRRSYGHTPPKKQAAKKDIYQIFAEKVRDHDYLESRWAVLEDTKVEYFRGEDLVSVLRNHLELKDVLESDKNLEAEDIANIMLRKVLIVRCDRVFKTVKPGKSKLSAWPAHLEISYDQVFSDDDAFFVWAFAKRRPSWKRLLTVFLTSFIAEIYFFSVYPNHVKSIFYFCVGVLLRILCLLLLRTFVFGPLWIILGKYVWFFPDILAEEATVKETFQFLLKKDENERPKWTSRLFYAVVAIYVILLLVRHNAPHRARYQEQVLHPT